jgi:hypothetical protein
VRGQKEPPGTREAPAAGLAPGETRRVSKSIRHAPEAGESERSVVAWKRGNARGAKGPWHGGAHSEDAGTDWRNPIAEPTSTFESEAAIGNQITVRCDECSKSSATRKPDAGNPHVRFEEGERTGGHWLTPFIPCVSLSLLYLELTSERRLRGGLRFGGGNSSNVE